MVDLGDMPGGALKPAGKRWGRKHVDRGEIQRLNRNVFSGKTGVQKNRRTDDSPVAELPAVNPVVDLHLGEKPAVVGGVKHKSRTVGGNQRAHEIALVTEKFIPRRERHDVCGSGETKTGPQKPGCAGDLGPVQGEQPVRHRCAGEPRIEVDALRGGR